MYTSNILWNRVRLSDLCQEPNFITELRTNSRLCKIIIISINENLRRKMIFL